MSESDHVLNGEDEKLKKGAFVSFRFVFVFVCRSVGRSVGEILFTVFTGAGDTNTLKQM